MLCFVSLSLSLATFIVPTQKHLSNLLTQITTAEKTFCSAPLSKTFFHGLTNTFLSVRLICTRQSSKYY